MSLGIEEPLELDSAETSVGDILLSGLVGNDQIDQLALEDFASRYGNLRLATVTVLIPAYQEENNIASVIDEIPSIILGMPVDVLVVTDGCNDATAEVARRCGAYVCEVPANRGQGAAYKLGYRLAIECGTQYVVTLDADGQYDPKDIANLLYPVLAGEVDFAQGSRLMGNAERDDSFRMAGVYFFGWLISLLLGQRVTDSSNGLRVMRSEVPETVRLSEDQYQSSEMLIGAVRCGFIYAEFPVQVRRRKSGNSKKAKNFLYGLQYLRVVLKSRFRRKFRNPVVQNSY
ncbi:MAG TPA: glycosyltransferase family 2 protein [Acidimicrobiales bacterium]|nr:glycosyltransferase family 2 protein [Acidimicrobiales bacterium]